MPGETNNSAIEDGSAGASPPPSSQSTAGGNSASGKNGSLQDAAVADSQASISERAPGESGQKEIDPLDAIYDELAAKGERTNDSRSASPSKADDQSGDDEPTPVAAADVNTAAATKQAEQGKQQQRQTAEYQGLTPDARGLLKNANLLIPPADWNALPEIARESMIESARAFRSEKERLFQQGRQQGNQQQQGQQGANQQQQQQQNAAQAQAATPQQIEAAFTQLASFGTDLAEPVKQIFQHQERQFAGHLQTLTDQFKEALGTRDQQIAFLMKRLESSEEHAAFEGDELKTLKALPEFSTKEVREEINRNARALLRAQFSAGNRDYTLKEALIQAANTRFHDKLQQAAQASLADSRKNSLRGTSSRPAAVVPAQKSKPRTEADAYDEVYDELYQRASK